MKLTITSGKTNIKDLCDKVSNIESKRCEDEYK